MRKKKILPDWNTTGDNSARTTTRRVSADTTAKIQILRVRARHKTGDTKIKL